MNDRGQYTPSIVTDQKGGALFCWYEAIINEEENSFARYYTQHIQSNGIRTWSDTGKVIMDSLTQPLIPMAVSDGAGGMIVYYGDDFQQVNNTYFERIDFFGNSLWKRASPTYKYKNMTSLGDKGAVFTGRSEYHSTTQKEDLYINIIDNNGNFLFEEEGLIYADSIEVFNQSNIIYNESNKLIYFSWARGVVHTYGLIDYQIMRLSGDLLFSNEANPVTVVQSSKGAPQIVGSEDNIIVMWRDSRDSTIDYSEIYSQKVDMLGNQLWDENDVAVSLAESNAWTLITDENSGAILVRSRDPHWGVYAQQINSDGELGIVTKVENEEENLADKIELLQNYPNPFNPTTKIKYTLTSQMERASGNNSGLRVRVLLKVYNILGKEVQTLVNGMQGRGTYEVEFNGRVLPSGVYLITLQAGSYRHTIKSLLIK
ncbi:MAG: T9SS type A sorting domain-containing protein [Melioribacteraceae bacterium]|nr:T9SS type A sorting domain-containing protein [Melioribacteraceae bacterium]